MRTSARCSTASCRLPAWQGWPRGRGRARAAACRQARRPIGHVRVCLPSGTLRQDVTATRQAGWRESQMGHRPVTCACLIPGGTRPGCAWSSPGGHWQARQSALTLGSVREVARGPLHDADHHGDFVVVIDTELGVGIVWGAEGTQECDVLLKLGQGRATGKSPLVLACIFVLRSHGHHLRGIERGPPDPQARRRALLVAASCPPVAAPGQGRKSRLRIWRSSPPATLGIAQSGGLTRRA